MITLGHTFLGRPTFFNVIGRIAFPIFAFQITEGYIHTKNLKQYFLRLGIFALISQIPFMIFLNSIGINKFTLNIFFTLILGLLCITIYDKSKNKSLGILLVLLLMILSELLKCDYGYYGIALTFLFYLFKNKKSYMNISVTFLIIVKYFSQLINVY